MYYAFEAFREEDSAPPTRAEPGEWRNDEVACIYKLGAWMSPSECAAARALAASTEWVDGQTSDASGSRRRSRSAWIARCVESEWLYRKTVAAFADVNGCFRYDIRGLNEELQLLRYTESGHLDWHLDVGPGGASVRKLSLVALLERSPDCRGGVLQFSGIDDDYLLSIGEAVVFPAFIAHRLTELLSGSRLALVAWACGPAFR